MANATVAKNGNVPAPTVPKFEVVDTASGLEVGQIVTERELETKHPGLGGVDRLIGLGAIRPMDDGSGTVPASSLAGLLKQDKKTASRETWAEYIRLITAAGVSNGEAELFAEIVAELGLKPEDVTAHQMALKEHVRFLEMRYRAAKTLADGSLTQAITDAKSRLSAAEDELRKAKEAWNAVQNELRVTQAGESSAIQQLERIQGRHPELFRRSEPAPADAAESVRYRQSPPKLRAAMDAAGLNAAGLSARIGTVPDPDAASNNLLAGKDKLPFLSPESIARFMTAGGASDEAMQRMATALGATIADIAVSLPAGTRAVERLNHIGGHRQQVA